MAVASRPRVLLLDEPAAGVPEDERHVILAIVAALPSDVTVLLIEHDMDLVFKFADLHIRARQRRACSCKARLRRLPAIRALARSISARRSMPDLLQVEALSAGYGEAVVLSDISFGIADGQALALLGRNGTGKTTLINSLVGLTTQHAGSIRLDGRDITRVRPERACPCRHWLVAAGAQHFQIADRRGEPDGHCSAGRVDACTRVRYVPAAGGAPGNLGSQLSGGEQQMLAIGRALILNPRIILLDEPLEGLAPIIVDELLAVLRKVIRSERMSAIVVEQKARKILGFTDRAVILERGRVVFEGDSAKLAASPDKLAAHLGVAEQRASSSGKTQ